MVSFSLIIICVVLEACAGGVAHRHLNAAGTHSARTVWGTSGCRSKDNAVNVRKRYCSIIPKLILVNGSRRAGHTGSPKVGRRVGGPLQSSQDEAATVAAYAMVVRPAQHALAVHHFVLELTDISAAVGPLENAVLKCRC